MRKKIKVDGMGLSLLYYYRLRDQTSSMNRRFASACWWDRFARQALSRRKPNMSISSMSIMRQPASNRSL